MTHLPGQATVHPDHDTILVAALAAGDLADAVLADAESLLAACPECATLHADLLAIAAATKALPAPVRSRDFRLTPAQAERLRPSRARRWLAAFASPRLAVTRPLAVAFTTLGIAGLLLTAVPAAGPLGVFSGAAQRDVAGERTEATGAIDLDDGGSGAEAVPSPTEPAGAAGYPVAPAASAKPGSGIVVGPAASPSGANDGAGQQKDDLASTADADAGAPWLRLLSIALLATGLGLFALRVAARRSGPR